MIIIHALDGRQYAYTKNCGSSLTPAASLSSEEAVIEAIKKRLTRSSADGIDRAVKFGQLVQQLLRQVYHHGRVVVHVLY